jgi:hypothetical protein
MSTSNSSPFLFKALLILQTIALAIYTAIAMQKEGLTLLQVIMTNLASMTWNGQFNLDFSCYLMLSGCWIVWRNRFSAGSIFLAAIAMIIGILVFAPYLLYLLSVEKGDLKKVLIGNR